MPYRVSPNEADRLYKEELARRRKLRLVQVRELAKRNAAKIREDVKLEKEKQLQKLANKISKEFEQQKDEELRRLQEKYDNLLLNVGEAHRDADRFDPKYEEQVVLMLEDQKRAEERHEAALVKLRQDREKKYAAQKAHIFQRKAALQLERIRASKIASLPPPPPDPIKSLKEPQHKPVKLFEASTFSNTMYHMPDYGVERADATEAGNAIQAAQEEALRVGEANELGQKTKQEMLEKARLRHSHAHKKELLKRDYDQLLLDLSDLQRADKTRRSQLVSHIPKNIFNPPHQRVEEKAEQQKDMDRAFESMYLAATGNCGDLSVALDPFTTPRPPNPSADLDVTPIPSDEEVPDEEGDKAMIGIRSKPLQEVTNTIAASPKKGGEKAKDHALKKLMSRIQKQRKDWENVHQAELTPMRDLPSEAMPVPPAGRESESPAETVSDQHPITDLATTENDAPSSVYAISTSSDSQAGTAVIETVVAENEPLLHPLEQAERVRRKSAKQTEADTKMSEELAKAREEQDSLQRHIKDIEQKLGQLRSRKKIIKHHDDMNRKHQEMLAHSRHGGPPAAPSYVMADLAMAPSIDLDKRPPHVIPSSAIVTSGENVVPRLSREMHSDTGRQSNLRQFPDGRNVSALNNKPASSRNDFDEVALHSSPTRILSSKKETDNILQRPVITQDSRPHQFIENRTVPVALSSVIRPFYGLDNVVNTQSTLSTGASVTGSPSELSMYPCSAPDSQENRTVERSGRDFITRDSVSYNYRQSKDSSPIRSTNARDNQPHFERFDIGYENGEIIKHSPKRRQERNIPQPRMPIGSETESQLSKSIGDNRQDVIRSALYFSGNQSREGMATVENANFRNIPKTVSCLQSSSEFERGEDDGTVQKERLVDAHSLAGEEVAAIKPSLRSPDRQNFEQSTLPFEPPRYDLSNVSQKQGVVSPHERLGPSTTTAQPTFFPATQGSDTSRQSAAVFNQHQDYLRREMTRFYGLKPDSDEESGSVSPNSYARTRHSTVGSLDQTDGPPTNVHSPHDSALWPLQHTEYHTPTDHCSPKTPGDGWFQFSQHEGYMSPKEREQLLQSLQSSLTSNRERESLQLRPLWPERQDSGKKQFRVQEKGVDQHHISPDHSQSNSPPRSQFTELTPPELRPLPRSLSEFHPLPPVNMAQKALSPEYRRRETSSSTTNAPVLESLATTSTSNLGLRQNIDVDMRNLYEPGEESPVLLPSPQLTPFSPDLETLARRQQEFDARRQELQAQLDEVRQQKENLLNKHQLLHGNDSAMPPQGSRRPPIAKHMSAVTDHTPHELSLIPEVDTPQSSHPGSRAGYHDDSRSMMYGYEQSPSMHPIPDTSDVATPGGRQNTTDLSQHPIPEQSGWLYNSRNMSRVTPEGAQNTTELSQHPLSDPRQGLFSSHDGSMATPGWTQNQNTTELSQHPLSEQSQLLTSSQSQPLSRPHYRDHSPRHFSSPENARHGDVSTTPAFPSLVLPSPRSIMSSPGMTSTPGKFFGRRMFNNNNAVWDVEHSDVSD